MTTSSVKYGVLEFGTLTRVPLLSIVVFTYERARLLREFLDSLASVPGVQECELILVNNGSAPDSYESLPDWLAALGMSCSLLTFPRNVLGPTRMRQALAHCKAEHVSHPGDDDILLPSLVSQFKDLRADAPNAVLYMAPAVAMNQDGTEHLMSVPNYPSAEIAIGNLLSSNNYTLPSAIIHRSVLEPLSASQTRTAADWNLWLRGWMLGPVAVGEEPTVIYRLHSGQEQRSYYAGSGYLDAIRMISSELAGPLFQDWLARRTNNELEVLAETILNGKGIAEDRGPESGLLQMMLADLIRDRVSIATRSSMYAQGAVSSGIPMGLEALKAAVQDDSLTQIPQLAWSRADIGMMLSHHHQVTPTFLTSLNLPSYSRQACKVTLTARQRRRGGAMVLSLDVKERGFLIFSHDIDQAHWDSPLAADRVLQGIALALRQRLHVVPSSVVARVMSAIWRVRRFLVRFS